MQNVFIETTKGWGKFMVARFDSELQLPSTMLRPDSPYPILLSRLGWGSLDIIVFDLTTREGAAFTPGGNAHDDLEQHKIEVCPLFESFLEWLYKQDLSDLEKLPKQIDLSAYGNQREGPKEELIANAIRICREVEVDNVNEELVYRGSVVASVPCCECAGLGTNDCGTCHGQKVFRYKDVVRNPELLCR